jgi:hypothetical protein
MYAGLLFYFTAGYEVQYQARNIQEGGGKARNVLE